MRDEARSLIQTQAVAVLLTLMVLLSRQGAPPFIFKSDIYFGVRVWYPLPRIFFHLPQVSAAYGPFWGWMEGYCSWLSGVVDNSLCE